MSDNVKHPSHYCKAGMECIDAIKAIVSTITDPFEAYCTGNIIKYIWRWHDKNGIEDLHKAIQYIDFIEQYRATLITSTDDFDMGEEDVSEPNEPVKGKYEGLSNDELHNKICHSFAACFGQEPDGCPLHNSKAHRGFCVSFREQHPAEFRKIAIAYLEKEGLSNE